MQFKNRYVFLAAAMVTSVVFGQANATAATYQNYHAATCVQTGSSPSFNQFGQLTAFSYTALFCPISSDWSNAATSSSTLEISGYGHSTGTALADITALACVTYYGGGGGQCGAAATFSSNPAVFHKSLPTSAWTSADDPKYAFVAMGGTVNASTSVLFGYRLTNP